MEHSRKAYNNYKIIYELPAECNEMILLDKYIYKETKKIALGESSKSPMLIELSDWFMKNLSVKILNIEFSKLKYPKTNRYRLYIIIENTRDYRKMYTEAFYPKEEYKSQIASEFKKITTKYKFATEKQLEDMLITYNDFSEEAKTEVNWKASNEVRKLLKNKFSVVWDVLAMFSSSVVFYYSDTDIVLNENNGINFQIKNDYYELLKKYDELDYFTRDNIELRFDSKENLDTNYGGSLYNYSR